MNSRERVATALNHMQPDRCPMQLSFTPEFRERLLHSLQPKSFGLDTKAQALERYLGADMLLASVGWMNSYYHTGNTYVDEWGVGWKAVEYVTPYGHGRYTEVAQNPLADDAAISSYKAPDPHRAELYAPARELISAFKQDHWIVGVTKTTIFECAWGLRGLEQLMMDFILDPDLADAVLDIPYQYHLEAAKQLVRDGVDMIWIGDDVGSQRGMLISPDTWRRFLKPRMASFIQDLHAINNDIVVAYHTDGAIDPIVADLVEIGLDVLNPIQPNCMDIHVLKQTYGKNLSFWGGIDQQNLLPFLSPQEVYSETKRIMGVLGEDGGYIVGPTHNVQLDVPLENFWAMVNAIMQ
jgi:uroporphyrinogen decarboxylase